MTQAELFGDYVLEFELEVVKNPICAMAEHCGAKAVLGPWEDRGGCVNRTITALAGCKCDGELSYQPDAARQAGWNDRR